MVKRTKIFVSIDWFLPGTASGGPVRSYANLINHLSDDFEYFIITRNTDYGSEKPYEGIVPNSWIRFNDYTKIYYISNSKLNMRHLAKVIKNTDFDIAYINGIYSWYFSILPIILLKQNDKPIIVSSRGMLNPQAFSIKGFKKKLFLNIANVIGFYKNIIFHATNLDEANHIKKILGTRIRVKIAPNLPRKIKENKDFKKRKNETVCFVNVARIAVEKGTLTMLKALKSIKKPLQLDLYGPIYDIDYWNKCQIVIEQLPEYINVSYKGVLPSELVPKTMQAYDFLLLLSEGENFGHAILEALSLGLPVLISNNTPWRDLQANRLGWDVNIENEEEVVVAIENALQMTNEDYIAWSQAACKYAKAFIENPEIIEKNKALFLNTKDNIN